MKKNIYSSNPVIFNGLAAVFAALVLVLCLFPRASAAVPGRINFQGKLLDTGNNPRNGSYDFTFRIFDVSSGGSSLWTEAQTGIVVNNGVFSVQLGSVTAIPLSVFSGATTYLEVQVGAEVGSPRERLIAVPYALRAAEAESLVGGIVMSSASVSGSGFSGTQTVFLVGGGTFTVLANGKVGIGTTGPGEKLHVYQASGEPHLAVESGDASAGIYIKAATAMYPYVRFYQGGTAQFELGKAASDGNFYFNNNAGSGDGGAAMVISNAGSVGIGVAVPTHKLHVEGNAVITASASVSGAGLSGTTPVFQVVGGTFTVLANGNVGIGTTSPASRLDMVGTLFVRQAGNNDNSGVVVLSQDGVSRAVRIWAGNDGASRIESGTGGSGALVLNSGGGNVGISTGAPQARLDVLAAGSAATDFAQIWRNSAGTIVSSMTATGVLYPGTAGSGDNLGNHTATAVLQMGAYGINTSSNITAARYQINGSTMVAILPGTDSIAYGISAGASNITGGNYNVFIGNYAGASNTTGFYNTATGYQALYSNTTSGNNTATGYYALRFNTTGGQNTANGLQALYSNTTGNNNTANGTYALYSNTTGNNNTANGYIALRFNTTGSYNTANGMYALNSNTTGINNTANGYATLYYNQTGSANSVFGVSAGGFGAGGVNSFSSATVMGYQAGYNLTTGSDNTFLGWRSGYNVTTGTRNIVIGYDQGTSAPDAGNELNIGGAIYGDLVSGNIGIGAAPTAKFQVFGGDAAVSTQGSGLILRATDGAACYRVTVNNVGTLSTASVTCP